MVLAYAIIIWNSQLYSQAQTLTLQPNGTAGVDAYVTSNNPSTNYANVPDFAAWTWTFGGDVGTTRSLVKFDLSSIPQNSTITSAHLSLSYSYNTPNAGQAGANECYLSEVTSSWAENTVTWNNQPSITTNNQVYIASSTSSSQSYLNIDVSALVQDATNSPSTYYGWMLSLLTEQTYRSMKFGSSDNSDAAIRPLLVINYLPPPADSCVTFTPGPTDGIDAYVISNDPSSNFANVPDFAAWTWTFGGDLGTSRSLMKFDLSSIPQNALITSAELSLYHSYNTTNAGQAGTNECYLSEITSPWTENTVTWNNQPGVTANNRVYLATSTSSTQSYSNIDVSALVQDAINTPSAYYGWMLSLLTEQTYRSMKFGSSDNSDAAIRPSLTICYSNPTNIKGALEAKTNWTIYPNPSNGKINIELNNPATEKIKTVSIFDLSGRLVKTISVQQTSENIVTMETIGISEGIYIIECVTDKTVMTKKISLLP